MRSMVEGTFADKDPSTALRAVPLPRKSGGGKTRPIQPGTILVQPFPATTRSLRAILARDPPRRLW